ncbi:type II 3-dehydroquinate dehydratase [Desnuesiella massiliensis]|uniref:type II 3-dehydroquinate dehydratase n=1 Tax=Desnuesiella massiliensis TaxID=1650662 RepID=UPI0006E24F00|nr:type II 3-dehydroquinate dehydratase [Desnuesiella massiliensis]
MKILVINGPNLDRLGMREKNIYGSLKLNEINEIIQNYFKNKNTFIDFIQSNDEGKIISEIGNSEEKYNGIVINPGAYSHYSIGILDAIRGINIPVVEVHLSNIHSREEYRKKTITGEGCLGVISGFGHYSYIMAINALIDFYSKS